jgi:hypothetical protein
MVRAMTRGMYRVSIAFLSAAVLVLAASETFARSGAGPRGAFASTRPVSPSVAHSFRHHGRNGFGTFWPGVGYSFDGPSYGAPLVDTAPPASNDVQYTYKYDVPWDWAHRFPPNVVPSDRPYVPGCNTETVKVPDNSGQEQAVNITRCY